MSQNPKTNKKKKTKNKKTCTHSKDLYQPGYSENGGKIKTSTSTLSMEKWRENLGSPLSGSLCKFFEELMRSY